MVPRQFFQLIYRFDSGVAQIVGNGFSTAEPTCTRFNGGVAQLGERCFRKAEARGPTPLTSTRPDGGL